MTLRFPTAKGARFALALAVASWLLAAGVARLLSFEAIRATDILFGLALVATYGCGCVVFVLGSRERRTAVYKVVIVTFVALCAIAMVEVPALMGRVNYRKV